MTSHPGEWNLVHGLWWLMAWLLAGALLSLVLGPWLHRRNKP